MNTVVKSPTPLPAKTGLTVFRAADYIRYKARHYGVTHIHKTLEGCLKELAAEKG